VDVREALIKGGREVTMISRVEFPKLEGKAIDFLKEKGMQIDTLEDEDVWMEKAMSTWPELYSTIGKDLSLLDKMMATLGRNRPQ